MGGGRLRARMRRLLHPRSPTQPPAQERCADLPLRLPPESRPSHNPRIRRCRPIALIWSGYPSHNEIQRNSGLCEGLLKGARDELGKRARGCGKCEQTLGCAVRYSSIAACCSPTLTAGTLSVGGAGITIRRSDRPSSCANPERSCPQALDRIALSRPQSPDAKPAEHLHHLPSHER